MNELQHEFLDIVAQVRAHLEYQRALGVQSIARETAPSRIASAKAACPAVAAPLQTAVPAVPAESSLPQQGSLASIREELGNCTRCKLNGQRKTIVFGEGNPCADLVFVGEGPGHEEDQQGRPFVGAAGRLLTDIIVKGMQMKREDVYICNIVKCRPPENQNPDPDEVEACEPFLIKQLAAIKPKVIVALGNVAAKTLLKTNEGITSLRGVWKTCQGIPLMPTFHPAYLLRNPKDKALAWKDIQQVMTELAKGRKG